jgi:trehalose synthase-fused probable maltokinase
MKVAITTKRFLAELRRCASPALPGFLTGQRWFGGKARPIGSVHIVDVVPVAFAGAFVLFAEVRYLDRRKETYVLPMVGSADQSPTGARSDPGKVLRIAGSSMGADVQLSDALENTDFLLAMMKAVAEGNRFPGVAGEICATRTSAFKALRGPATTELLPTPLRAEQSNTSINFGNRLILKFFRRLQTGVNPDWEIGRFLTEQVHFPHVPAVAGALEYRSKNGKKKTLGILQSFVPNQGNAWDYALRSLTAFYERVEGLAIGPKDSARTGGGSRLDLADQDPPPEAAELAGSALSAARLLGERTAQLHLALASTRTIPAFRPEPYTSAFRKKLGASMRDWTARTLRLLVDKKTELPERWHDAADRIAGSERELRRRTGLALGQNIAAMRTRIHGDYHLGQVLHTGSDFVIIDFEGEPARSIAERRTKRSPLQDVAGMLRSFHYAAFASLLGGKLSGGATSAKGPQVLETWANRWWEWMSSCFLRTYLRTSGRACYIPRSRKDLSRLLDFHLLEKAIYELNYELNNRPAWVGIPLRGIASILASDV